MAISQNFKSFRTNFFSENVDLFVGDESPVKNDTNFEANPDVHQGIENNQTRKCKLKTKMDISKFKGLSMSTLHPPGRRLSPWDEVVEVSLTHGVDSIPSSGRCCLASWRTSSPMVNILQMERTSSTRLGYCTSTT